MKSIPLILAFAALAGAQAPPPASFDCALDGSVVNSVTGEPIQRAHVGLQAPGAGSAATDSTGKWSLSNVACGAVQLMVTRPGFLTQGRRLAAVVSGSPVHDVKIALAPQSVFYGKVVDDQGDPLTQVRVRALSSRVADGQIRFQQDAESLTNDLGEYRIAGLRRGRYIVCASAQDGLMRPDRLMVASTCYPGPEAAGNASAMEVAQGRDVKVDFALNPVQAVRVRGTVSGLPEGRGVGISTVPRGAIGDTRSNAGATIRGGAFDVRVVAGSYMLMADYFEGGKHLFARVPFDAGATDIENLTVTMDTGISVAGTLRIESQSRQPGGKPQFGVNLTPSEPLNATGQVRWDADRSSFTFVDLLPGSYRLDAFPPPPFYLKSATLAGQDILNGEFTLSPGSGPIALVLADDGGSIEGDVVNADGQPAAGGVLALRNGRASTIQSGSGHFKLEHLAPGDYKVYAWDEPSDVPWADADWMRRYAGGGVDVTVAAGQSSQVKLTQQNVPQ